MTADKNFKRRVRERAARTGESYVTARRQLLPNRQEDAMATTLVPVDYLGVSRGTAQNQEFCRVHLGERGGDREVCIFVGSAEGAAIVLGATHADLPRPMTHDMLKQAVEGLGATPERIVIDLQPETNTYTATLRLRRDDGSMVELDCRPSDVVALAVRYENWPDLLVPAELLSVPELPYEQAQRLELQWAPPHPPTDEPPVE